MGETIMEKYTPEWVKSLVSPLLPSETQIALDWAARQIRQLEEEKITNREEIEHLKKEVAAELNWKCARCKRSTKRGAVEHEPLCFHCQSWYENIENEVAYLKQVVTEVSNELSVLSYSWVPKITDKLDIVRQSHLGLRVAQAFKDLRKQVENLKEELSMHCGCHFMDGPGWVECDYHKKMFTDFEDFKTMAGRTADLQKRLDEIRIILETLAIHNTKSTSSWTYLGGELQLMLVFTMVSHLLKVAQSNLKISEVEGGVKWKREVSGEEIT